MCPYLKRKQSNKQASKELTIMIRRLILSKAPVHQQRVSSSITSSSSQRCLASLVVSNHPPAVAVDSLDTSVRSFSTTASTSGASGGSRGGGSAGGADPTIESSSVLFAPITEDGSDDNKGIRNEEANSAVRDSNTALHQLVEQLLSYDSLKTAVVDREEDFSPNPRFSQLILKDVLSIVKEMNHSNHLRHNAARNARKQGEQQSNQQPEQLCSPQELMSLVHTLVLPTADMTIPSHAITAVLDLVLLTLKQYNHANTTTKLHLDDAHVAQELLHKTRSMQIYYTTPFVHTEMEEWKASILVALNLTLNLYSHVAATIYDPVASKQVVQFAENLLMESGTTSSSTNGNGPPERLQLQPDVVSFNTVMTAWGKSVRRLASKSRVKDATNIEAIQHAAERAEAILNLLLEISEDDGQHLEPTAYSYTSAMACWAAVDTPEAAAHVMDDMLGPMVNQYVKSRNSPNRWHPAPTAATLVTATKVLSHNVAGRDLQRHVEQLLTYREQCRIPMDTILANAILTAYVKTEPKLLKDWLFICKHMIAYFDKHYDTGGEGDDAVQQRPNCQPDSVSYMLLFLGIKQCLHKWRKPHNLFPKEAERFLQQAADANLTDTRMYNDVLGALHFHAGRAETLFEKMGPAQDYNSHRALLESYEMSSSMSGVADRVFYPGKAEELLKQMETLSDSDPSMRPTTSNYNSVILAWLEQGTIEGVERAHGVLQGLLEKYQERVHELSDDPQLRIVERPNNTSFIPIMAAFSKHGSIQHIEVVEQLLQQLGDLQLAKSQAPANIQHKMAPIVQNVVGMNVMLDLYAKFSRRHPDTMLNKIEALLARMGGAKPDHVSYSIALKACAAASSDVERTMRILALAKRRGSYVDVRLYNAALNALAASSMTEEGCVAAEQLLMEMKEHTKPDQFSFAAVIKAWSSVGTTDAMEKADQVLQQAIDTGQADTFCFNSVIAGFSRVKTDDARHRAKDVYFKMQQASEANPEVTPTAYTYQCLSMTGSALDALELLQEMIDRFEKSGLKEDCPNGKTFSHVISRLFHDKNYKEAAEKIQQVVRMKIKLYVDRDGPEPTTYDVDSAIKKMAVAGLTIDAEKFLDELYTEHFSWAKHEISTGAYNSILHGYATETSHSIELAVKALKLLDKMEERHINEGAVAKPSGRSYADCIAAWASSRADNRDERAEELVNRMMQATNSESPDLARAFNLVLKACKQVAGSHHSRDPTTAVQRGARIFGEMMKYDNVVNASSYAYMLNLTSWLPDEQKENKLKMYQKLMVECQKGGFVSPSVLGTFGILAPPALVANVLRVPQADIQGIKVRDLPTKWTCNAHTRQQPRK